MCLRFREVEPYQTESFGLGVRFDLDGALPPFVQPRNCEELKFHDDSI